MRKDESPIGQERRPHPLQSGACSIGAGRSVTTARTQAGRPSAPSTAQVDPQKRCAPFLKWVGGKRPLIEGILPHLTGTDGRYFEPFLGGGAVFFALRPKRAVLSDVNALLIETFATVRDIPDVVIRELEGLRHNKQEYYRIRDWRPRNRGQRAARFIYLNKTCFNGVYRENLKGDFNVPYGRHGRSLVICDAEQIRAASAALHGVTLKAGDFQKIVAGARSGDIVYFDPPYTTAHANNGFIEYNAKVFGWADQERLALVAARLVERGVTVVQTNADHSSIRKLYNSAFEVVELNRWSTIAASRKKRYPTTELLLKGSAPRAARKH
jgi:DNA adenine methylase